MVLVMTFVALPLLALVISGAVAMWLLLHLRLASVTTCRGCGENLWGMRKVAICPTCGGDRRVPRSQRGADGGRGRVRRRRRATAALTWVAALSALCLGFDIAYVAAGKQLNSYKPTWVLIEEAARAQKALDDARQDDPNVVAENAPMAELTNRIPTMPRDHLQSLIDRALELQQDDVKTGRAQQNIRYQWYCLIERAQGLGLVSASDWARYLSQGADESLTLLLRRQVTRGDPLVLAINCNPVFGGGLQVTFDSDHVPTIAGRKAGTPHPPAPYYWVDEKDETVVDLPPDLLSTLPDGAQSTDVTAIVNVRDNSHPSDPPVYSKTITLSGVWTLLPASTPSLTIDKSIQNHELDMMTSATHASFVGNGMMGVFLSLDWNFAYVVANHPSLLQSRTAYRVYARGDGREWELGRVIAQSNLNVTFPSSGYAAPGRITSHELPSVVDIVIRPNDEDAVRTIVCTQTWRGEIVVPNVPVR